MAAARKSGGFGNRPSPNAVFLPLPSLAWHIVQNFALVKDRLTPGGTMSMQAGMTKRGELAFFTSIHRTLREVFPIVAGYQTFVSCFGTPWGFIVASKKVDPNKQDVKAVDKLIADRIKGSLEYWDGVTHQHAFSLPKFIRKSIAKQTRVVTDANPLIVT